MNDKQKELSLLFRHLSHDLRNTLGSNAKLLEMLETYYADVLDERAKRWLQLINNESSIAMQKLIGFSEIGKIVGTELQAANHDLFSIVERACIEALSDLELAEDRLQIQIPKGIKYYCQADLLQKAIECILLNCKEHACENIEDLFIRIQLVVESDKYSLCISDNGNQLREELYENILTPFRGKPVHQENKGLGLNKAKQILFLHHASMRLEKNSPNGGLKVIFELPFNESNK